MTTAAELRNELQALGVTLAADGDRLRFHPRDKVTGELLQRLRDCKNELLAMLQPQDGGPSDAAGGGPQDPQPQDLPGGDRHGANGPQGDHGDAQPSDGDADGWILQRIDATDLQVIDLPTPCPVCGGIVFWWDAAGGAHCLTCSPVPGRGQQLRQRAAELRERTTAAHAPTWPIAGADAALQLTPDDLPPVPWHIDGLNCCDNARLLNELRIDLAVIGKGGPHHRSGQLGRHIQRLLRAAQRHGARPTESGNHRQALPAVEWPAALADFCLLLAPDDLPSVPFKLDTATTVVDRRKYLTTLQTEIRSGPSGPRARRGILQDELQRLRMALFCRQKNVARFRRRRAQRGFLDP